MGWIVPQAQTRWLAAGVAWYTPQRCEQIFRQALAGDLQSQWEMFDLMEATWPELSTCLGQLKDSVVDQGFRVQPYCRKGEKPTATALARAALVQECIEGMRPNPARDENDLEDTIRDLLDARAKGISILEVDWEYREQADLGGMVAPRCTRWVHPLWYGYPHGPGSGQLMLRPGIGNGDPKKQWFPGDTSVGYGYAWGSNSDWQDFPDGKFIIGVAKNKTGHPLGGAMLHVLAFWWAASNMCAEWFFNFAQVFGQPFRWATYDPNMTPTDQMKLQAVLTNMGASAWGMFPEGTNFELKDTASKAGDNPNFALIEMANKVCRLLILRQTLTADAGPAGSKALGEVHERVLGGVEEVCGKWACKTMAQLVRAICVLNYGDLMECPAIVNGMDEEASPAELGDLLVKANQAGLELTDEAIPEISERLGFQVQRATPAPSPFGAPPAGFGSARPGEDMPPEKKEPPDKTEAEAARGEKRPDPTAPVVDARAEVLANAYRGVMAPFREIILNSTSQEDCLRKLEKAYADWDPARLAAEMETALQLCAAAGTR